MTMTDDEKRPTERRRQMDEMLRQAEADVARSRAAKQRPVVDQRLGTAWGSALGVAILLALAAVFIMGTLTVSRFTGADFDDASRQGTATVKSCERRGPMTTKGFGYYDRCTVDIAWNDGQNLSVTIDKPGFIRGEKPGDTFEIGRNTGTRGSVSYSRPELQPQGWVVAVSIVFGGIALLCLAGVYIYLRAKIKDMRGRR
jgi:hypothetical protein